MTYWKEFKRNIASHNNVVSLVNLLKMSDSLSHNDLAVKRISRRRQISKQLKAIFNCFADINPLKNFG